MGDRPGHQAPALGIAPHRPPPPALLLDTRQTANLASVERRLPAGVSPAQALGLQRTVGNQALGRMLAAQARGRLAARETATDRPPEPVAAAGAPAQSAVAPPSAPPGAPTGVAPAPPAPAPPAVAAPGTLPPTPGPGAPAPTTTPAKALGPGTAPEPASEVAAPTRVPTPEQPKTDTDWGAWWRTDYPTAIRTALEVVRLYPGYGFLAGGAADIMGGAVDLAGINNEEAPAIKGMLVFRNGVNALNNAFGHLAYVNQLLADGATLSVFGAVLVPFNAGANELIKLEKVFLDTVVGTSDVLLLCAAKYRLSHAKPPSADAWQKMVDGYEANIAGDVVATFLDVVDLSNGGFTNGEPIKQGVHVLRAILRNGKRLQAAATAFAQGMFNVFGGTAVEKGKKLADEPSAPGLNRLADGPATAGPAGGLPRRVAAAMMLEELQAIKGAYVVGDALVDAAATVSEQQTAQLAEIFKTVSGGKDPFVFARDSAVAGLQHLEEEITRLTELGVFASTAQEKTQAIQGVCDPALALVDKLHLPPPPPKKEAGALEIANAVLNPTGALAGLAGDALVARVRGSVDDARETLRAPIVTVKANATEIGDFLQILTAESKSLAESTQAKVTSMRTGLAKCHNIEDVFNALIKSVMEMMGISGTIEIEDFRRGWKELGPEIDGWIASAEHVSQGGDGELFEPPTPAPRKAGGATGADDAPL